MKQACVDGCLAMEEFFWNQKERICMLNDFRTKAANVSFLVRMFNYYAKIIYFLFRKPY